MTSYKLTWTIAVAVILALPLTSAVVVNSCGTAITSSGSHTVGQDINVSGWDYCINITASNVILDCQDYTIGAHGLGVGNRGVYITSVDNVTVHNCHVEQYDYGFEAFHSTGITFYDVSTYNITPDGGWGGSIRYENTSHAEAYNFTFPDRRIMLQWTFTANSKNLNLSVHDGSVRSLYTYQNELSNSISAVIDNVTVEGQFYKFAYDSDITLQNSRVEYCDAALTDCNSYGISGSPEWIENVTIDGPYTRGVSGSFNGKNLTCELIQTYCVYGSGDGDINGLYMHSANNTDATLFHYSGNGEVNITNAHPNYNTTRFFDLPSVGNNDAVRIRHSTMTSRLAQQAPYPYGGEGIRINQPTGGTILIENVTIRNTTTGIEFYRTKDGGYDIDVLDLHAWDVGYLVYAEGVENVTFNGLYGHEVDDGFYAVADSYTDPITLQTTYWGIRGNTLSNMDINNTDVTNAWGIYLDDDKGGGQENRENYFYNLSGNGLITGLVFQDDSLSPGNTFDCGARYGNIARDGLYYSFGAFEFDDLQAAQVHDCHVEDFGYIFFSKAGNDNMNFTDIYGKNLNGSGYLIGFGDNNNHFTGITIINPATTASGSGFQFSGRLSGGNRLENCIINMSESGSATGAITYSASPRSGSSNEIVDNCTVYSYGFLGVNTAGARSDKNDNNQILNSYFNGTALYGLEIDDGDNWIINGTDVLGYQTGIWFDATGTGSNIYNSSFCFSSTVDANDADTNTWTGNYCNTTSGNANCTYTCPRPAPPSAPVAYVFVPFLPLLLIGYMIYRRRKA